MKYKDGVKSTDHSPLRYKCTKEHWNKGTLSIEIGKSMIGKLKLSVFIEHFDFQQLEFYHEFRILGNFPISQSPNSKIICNH